MRPLRVYIAAPYSADTEEERLANVEKVIAVAREVMGLGHHPFVPHLSHYIDPQNDRFEWEQWMDWCIDWLGTCDILLYLGSSKGADLELEVARKRGKPVAFSVKELERFALFFEEE